MAGRDEEFKHLIKSARIPAGGRDLGHLQHGPPDPREMPVTVHEVKLRNCWHKYEPLMVPQDDGTLKFVMWSIVLLDPNDRTVYHYGLSADDLESEIAKLQAMVELRDHPPTVDKIVQDTEQTFGEEAAPDGDSS